MGRLENRVRRLEEHDRRVGYRAAMQRVTDEEAALIGAYIERWFAARDAGEPEPRPTPEEVGAFDRLEEHRQKALREGWGNSGFRIC